MELQPRKNPVAYSMRVLLPPKKLKKSPKLDKVDLVADIESAYGKAFGSDLLPSEKSIANRSNEGVTSAKIIYRDLNSINNSSVHQSTATAPSSVLKKKKKSEVLAQI